MKRILITGSRDWTDEMAIFEAIDDVRPKDEDPTGWGWGPATVIHGGASGADAIAGKVARFLGLEEEVHYADWQGQGKAAGPLRNQKMVDSGADVCLAFILNGSRGASDCARRAEAAGIPVQRFEVNT